jgi:hypothetical protein
MADANLGITESTAVAEARIANLIQSFLIQESVMLDKVTDVSYLCGPGAKSVSLGRSSGFTVSSKGENVASVKDDSNAYAVDTLDINIHRKVQWLWEDFASMAALPNIVADSIMKASKAVAKDMDDYVIAALIAGASTSSPDHVIQYNDAANEDLDLSDILRIRALLQAQNINPMESYLGISPSQEKNLLGISNFIEAAKWGDSNPIQNGIIGKIYGMKVLVTNGLSASDKTIAWHPTALALGTQIAPRLQSQYVLSELGTLFSVDTKYGLKVLDSGKRNVTMEQTA